MVDFLFKDMEEDQMVEDMVVVIAMDTKKQKMEEVSVEADSVKRKNTFDLMEHQQKVVQEMVDTVMAMDTVLKVDSEAHDSNKFLHPLTYHLTLRHPHTFPISFKLDKYHGS